MKLKQIFTTGFFSLTLVASGIAYVAPAAAEDVPGVDPELVSAEAKNTGGSTAKEAGDSIVINFSESTNKFTIDASNIDDQFELNNGHSFLDGNNSIESAEWSEDGTSLVIRISDAGGLPDVAVGDEVTYSGEGLEDLDGNAVTGSAIIEGSFTDVADPTGEECTEDEDESGDDNSDDSSDVEEDDNSGSDSESDLNDDDEDNVSATSSNSRNRNRSVIREQHRHHGCDDSDEGKYRCGIGLQNGRLYKIAGSPTVYLMAACRLKPFRGIAAFHSRGLKFTDIIELPALPAKVLLSDKPALPAEGTLIKGSDATVWFLAKNGKREGFTSAAIFLALGFKFEEVDQISDSDLSTVETDTELIDDPNEHPDGALIKCGNSGTVFKKIGNLRFPFANLESFQGRGHSFDKILEIDCGRFAYREGAPITE